MDIPESFSMLGDEAYPLKNNLLRPYRENDKEKNYSMIFIHGQEK